MNAIRRGWTPSGAEGAVLALCILSEHLQSALNVMVHQKILISVL